MPIGSKRRPVPNGLSVPRRRLEAATSTLTPLCQNCALLGGVNCECANMIEFSLARHLVAPYQRQTDTERVAEDLRRFADEIELYRSLPDPTAAIAAALESTRFGIFAAK